MQAPLTAPILQDDGNAYSQYQQPTSTANVVPRVQQTAPQSTIDVIPVGELLKPTTSFIASSSNLHDRWNVPFGVVARPMAPLDHPIPLRDFSPIAPPRCASCRAYICCYNKINVVERQWKCVTCNRINALPDSYTADPQSPERVSAAYEVKAPPAYMSRDPVHSVYVFALDCSTAAVESGLLSAACSALAAALPSIAAQTKPKIAVVTYDENVTFWMPKAGSFMETIVPIAPGLGVFVPVPAPGLTIQLDEEGALEAATHLMNTLPARYAVSSRPGGAVGPAVLSACKIIASTGGKVSCFMASRPTIGDGAIDDRTESGKLNVESKNAYVCPDDFFRSLAVEASQTHTSIDLYCAGTGQTHLDAATVSVMPRLTGGRVRHYPAFRGDRDGEMLGSDVRHAIEGATGWEAVFRARVSPSVKVARYHGSFFIRQTNLLNIANVDEDTAIGVELQVDESILTPEAFIQTALLYTTSTGERRVRVVTLPLPVTSNIQDMYRGADVEATLAMIAKKSAMLLYDGKRIEELRRTIHKWVVGCLSEYRLAVPSARTGLVLPEQFRLLPLMALALIKAPPLRMTPTCSWDDRAAVLATILRAPVHDIRFMLYPRCYAVAFSGDREIAISRLLFSKLDTKRVYVVEAAHAVYVWIGRDLPAEVSAVLRDENGGLIGEFGTRVYDTVQLIRQRRASTLPYYIVDQGSSQERSVGDVMIDGPVHGQDYQGYLNGLHAEVSKL